MPAPPTEVIRHASVYADGKKVAMFTGFSYPVESNNEDQIADEGWIGTSDGPTTTKLTTDAIVPVRGIQVGLLERLLARKYIDIGLGIVDGKVHKIRMKIMRCEYTSNAQNGTLTGRFEFSGGEPELVG